MGLFFTRGFGCSRFQGFGFFISKRMGFWGSLLQQGLSMCFKVSGGLRGVSMLKLALFWLRGVFRL